MSVGDHSKIFLQLTIGDDLENSIKKCKLVDTVRRLLKNWFFKIVLIKWVVDRLKQRF